jgi:hypothetical protein
VLLERLALYTQLMIRLIFGSVSIIFIRRIVKRWYLRQETFEGSFAFPCPSNFLPFSHLVSVALEDEGRIAHQCIIFGVREFASSSCLLADDVVLLSPSLVSEKELRELRVRQRATIEDIKKKTNYYTTKNLLDRYDNGSAAAIKVRPAHLSTWNQTELPCLPLLSPVSFRCPANRTLRLPPQTRLSTSSISPVPYNPQHQPPLLCPKLSLPSQQPQRPPLS